MKRCLVPILFLLLCAAAFSQSITLAWDPVVDTNLGGYRVYCGSATGVYTANIDAAKATTFKITAPSCGLTCGKRYYFAVTARSNDTIPMESGYSNEVTEAFVCNPAGLKITATSVTAIQRKEATLLASTNEPATTVLSYSIGGAWYAVAVEAAPALEHKIVLSNLRPHTTYRYRWSATTPDGVSDATEIATFTTQ